MIHLWQVDHPYYCNLGNYFDRHCGSYFDSFDDFLEEWGDLDFDYNLLFRWDWKDSIYKDNEMKQDELQIFWLLQRKGIYQFSVIKVNKEDEERVRKFLQPRWEYMKKIWFPLE